eukprot:GHVU01141004.1.p1 GENE.GHVU01141004.1~~GHVU01141004.1.p1  ORF type:complete len:275 (-),score=-0.46 GHVU01141004.1:39-863(-)
MDDLVGGDLRGAGLRGHDEAMPSPGRSEAGTQASVHTPGRVTGTEASEGEGCSRGEGRMAAGCRGTAGGLLDTRATQDDDYYLLGSLPSQENYPSPPQRMQGRKRRGTESGVYEHFDAPEETPGGTQWYRCKTCRVVFRRHVGNQRRHLTTHGMSVEIPPTARTRGVAVDSNPQNVGIMAWLVAMVIDCALPFSIVDHPTFQRFVQALCSTFRVPSRRTLCRRIRVIHGQVKRLLVGRIWQLLGARTRTHTHAHAHALRSARDWKTSLEQPGTC